MSHRTCVAVSTIGYPFTPAREAHERYIRRRTAPGQTERTASHQVVYLGNGGRITVDLQGHPPDKFVGQWLNPRSGEWKRAASAADGGGVVLAAPSEGDWVLRLRRPVRRTDRSQAPAQITVLPGGPSLTGRDAPSFPAQSVPTQVRAPQVSVISRAESASRAQDRALPGPGDRGTAAAACTCAKPAAVGGAGACLRGLGGRRRSGCAFGEHPGAREPLRW